MPFPEEGLVFDYRLDDAGITNRQSENAIDDDDETSAQASTEVYFTHENRCLSRNTVDRC